MQQLRTLMLVEDDPHIQEIAKLALETVGGFEVEICELGEQALQRAEEIDPDLILLDVMMPHMDGPTTLRKLRQLPAIEQTPVIFLTAKTRPAEVRELLALGAIGVVAKPFNPMGLADEVRAIWEKQTDPAE